MKEILLTSSALILAVVALRWLFRRKVSRRLIYGAWLLVALRLLIPIQFGSLDFSILSQAEPVTDAITQFADKPVSGPSREEVYNDTLRDYIATGQPVFVPEVQDRLESEIQQSGRPAQEVCDDLLESNQAENILLPEVSQQINTAVENTVTAPSIGQIATVVWIIGMAAMAGWFLGVNVSFHRHLKRTAKHVDIPGCPVPVRTDPTLTSPCLFGLWKPTIYLTPACSADSQARRHVLAHELTHLRHGDHLWALVRCICLCIYWFNPLVWVAAGLSKRDCELACDETVLKTLGEEERIAYGRTLVDMVASSPSPSRFLETATAMHETKKQLKERMNCIVKKQNRYLIAAVALLLVLTVATGCAFSGSGIKPAGILDGDTTAPAATTQPSAAAQPTDTAPATNPEPSVTHKLTVMVRDALPSDFSWTDRDKSSVWPAVEQMLAEKGVELEFMIQPDGDYEYTVHSVLTGDSESLPDVIWLGGMSAETKAAYAEAGYFTSLEEILPYSDGTAVAWLDSHPLYSAKVSIDGKLWWFGSYTQVLDNGQALGLAEGSPSGIVVREDWMNALGMTEIPNTIEELEAFLLACRKADVNGSGTQDEMVNLRLNNLWNCGLNGFFGVPCAEFCPNLTTGQVVTPWEADGVKDMLRICLDWLDKGYLDPDTIDGLTVQLRVENRSAIQLTYFCDNWSVTDIEVPEGAATPNLVGVLPDKTQYPDAYLRRDVTQIADLYSMAFTSSCTDPEAAAALLDVITSEEFAVLLEWGVEGYGYTVNSDGEKKVAPSSGSTFLQANGREVFSFGIFPDGFKVNDVTDDDTACYTERMLQQHRAGMEWETDFATGTRHLLAAPTAEELAVLKLEESYNELSAAIFCQILRGEIDIETQWESHVLKPLKEAGMDQLKEVYQARFDRFMEGANS